MQSIITASTLLDAAILGQTMVLVSYTAISLVKHAIKYSDRYSLKTSPEAYSQALTTIAQLHAEEPQPETELEFHLREINWQAQILALVAIAFIAVANDPEVSAQPLLPGSIAIAALPAAVEEPEYIDLNLGVTKDQIDEFDRKFITVDVPVENWEVEYDEPAAPCYDEWTVAQLRAETNRLGLTSGRKYIKKTKLIALLEGA